MWLSHTNTQTQPILAAVGLAPRFTWTQRIVPKPDCALLKPSHVDLSAAERSIRHLLWILNVLGSFSFVFRSAFNSVCSNFGQTFALVSTRVMERTRSISAPPWAPLSKIVSQNNASLLPEKGVKKNFGLDYLNSKLSQYCHFSCYFERNTVEKHFRCDVKVIVTE